MDETVRKNTFRKAFKDTIPVMTGYLVLGFGFGLLMVSKGFSMFLAVLMSVLIYAGSMQYAAVDLLVSGANLISAAILTLMINARHLFYGISMLVRYKDMKRFRKYLIFALTDETYSLVSSDIPEGCDKEYYSFYVSVLDQTYWVTGTLLGTIFGNIFTFNTAGVDFSMTALFTIIMTDHMMKKENRPAAVTGLMISLICLLVFGPSDFLIPAMAGITAALLLLKKQLEGGAGNA